MMRSHYSETLWDKIVNGQDSWNSKGPFCGKKKGFRLLRDANRSLEWLACFKNTVAL